MAITASKLANLCPLIEKVNDDRIPIEITSRRGDAVLLSREDYEALEETAHLLRVPRPNARRLIRACSRPFPGSVKSTTWPSEARLHPAWLGGLPTGWRLTGPRSARGSTGSSMMPCAIRQAGVGKPEPLRHVLRAPGPGESPKNAWSISSTVDTVILQARFHYK